MSIPPMWVTRNMQRLLKVQGVEVELKRLRPDLEQRIAMDDVKMFVRVSLESGGSVLAYQCFDYPGSWLIFGPQPTRPPQGWHLGSPADVVAKALLAQVDALEHERPVVSPWRWGESESSSLVELADHLTDAGYFPSEVCALNRFRWSYKAGKLKGTKEEPEAGRFLRLEVGGHAYRLSLRDDYGWLLDQIDGPNMRRIDLVQCLTGTASAEPGLPDNLISVLDLARVTVTAVTKAERRGPILLDDGSYHSGSLAPSIKWLKAIGFGGITVRIEANQEVVESSRLHIYEAQTSGVFGLPDMQRAMGIAAVHGKKLVVVSASGYSRPAVKFGDQAGAIMLIQYEGREDVVGVGRVFTALKL